jgi:hypothetical protein
MRVELSGKQADLYETIRLGMEKTVRDALNTRGLAKSQITILDALLKLRQVCCDPQLLPLASAKKIHHSAKLEQLMEMLPEMLAEGRRILLFSQFTSMLTLIEAELEQRGLPWVKLTGQSQKRDELIERFTSGAVPLFLISLKAGGTGLNLPQADTVIHYDPWWNPAVERRLPIAPIALARRQACGWSNWSPRARLRNASSLCRNARRRWPTACTAVLLVASNRCLLKVIWRNCSSRCRRIKRQPASLSITKTTVSFRPRTACTTRIT